MNRMTAHELRSRFLEFFRRHNHKLLPSASLIPENDPTVLFTTAGMHPLVPFLLGQPHPAGKRLANVQRCLRTGDIDLVGDDQHLTFFEMLGNWSLGDYFKREAIAWSWEFITDSVHGLGLDPHRISVSVFAGDSDAPRDEESAALWGSMGISEKHIYFFGKEQNWWGPAGKTGPCGPDTEMFFDTQKSCELGARCTPDHDCGRFVEFWNNVFMQYQKQPDGTYEPLQQKNVDTGMGLERTLVVVNNLASVFECEMFTPLMLVLSREAQTPIASSARIVADHLKAAVFITAEGIDPSNKDQGYVLRRLLRRAVFEMQRLGIMSVNKLFSELIDVIVAMYRSVYPLVEQHAQRLQTVMNQEAERFSKIISNAQRLIEKSIKNIEQQKKAVSVLAFDLFQTNGIPPEITFDFIRQRLNLALSKEEFMRSYQSHFAHHQEVSRKGAEKKFRGGLADHSERVIRMHTATHLLHQALRDVLGTSVFQKGSNITQERLRFDFTFPRKMTTEELQRVETIVNEKVQAELPVQQQVLPVEEAKKIGAIGLFGEKYGEKVSVYSIGDYSKEFCGGPHVTNTQEVGTFRILKEEAVSAGVRRIKAEVQP